eukprot:364967-Chlamydomonas_euryale.AAC.1
MTEGRRGYGTGWLSAGTRWLDAGTGWLSAGSGWLIAGIGWLSAGSGWHWVAQHRHRVAQCRLWVALGGSAQASGGSAQALGGTGWLSAGTGWLSAGAGWLSAGTHRRRMRTCTCTSACGYANRASILSRAKPHSWRCRCLASKQTLGPPCTQTCPFKSAYRRALAPWADRTAAHSPCSVAMRFVRGCDEAAGRCSTSAAHSRRSKRSTCMQCVKCMDEDAGRRAPRDSCQRGRPPRGLT